MFNKKIISLLSLLLITGSSYVIYRKKNNDGQVNLTDNSINYEEESINENTESSSSFIFIIAIIVIIFVIVSFIFYLKNKKGKEVIEELEELKGLEDNKEPTKAEKDAEILEGYKQFKEIPDNKAKIEQETIKEKVMKEILNFLETEATQIDFSNFLQDKDGIDIDNYVVNEYFIDFSYPYANNKIKNYPKKNNKIIYRFNITEHRDFFIKIFFKLFEVFVNSETYNDNNFNTKDDKLKRDIMFFFIATVVEPVIKAVSKHEHLKKHFTFNYKKDNNVDCLEQMVADMLMKVAAEEEEKEKEIAKKADRFFNYLSFRRGEYYFSLIFNQLNKEYFPTNFVPKKIDS